MARVTSDSILNLPIIIVTTVAFTLLILPSPVKPIQRWPSCLIGRDGNSPENPCKYDVFYGWKATVDCRPYPTNLQPPDMFSAAAFCWNPLMSLTDECTRPEYPNGEQLFISHNEATGKIVFDLIHEKQKLLLFHAPRDVNGRCSTSDGKKVMYFTFTVHPFKYPPPISMDCSFDPATPTTPPQPCQVLTYSSERSTIQCPKDTKSYSPSSVNQSNGSICREPTKNNDCPSENRILWQELLPGVSVSSFLDGFTVEQPETLQSDKVAFSSCSNGGSESLFVQHIFFWGHRKALSSTGPRNYIYCNENCNPILDPGDTVLINCTLASNRRPNDLVAAINPHYCSNDMSSFCDEQPWSELADVETDRYGQYVVLTYVKRKQKNVDIVAYGSCSQRLFEIKIAVTFRGDPLSSVEPSAAVSSLQPHFSLFFLLSCSVFVTLLVSSTDTVLT